jgi:hypothetical protein
LIVDLARFMTLADIAGWLSLSWETVRTVVQRRLEKDYRRIGLPQGSRHRHRRTLSGADITLPCAKNGSVNQMPVSSIGTIQLDMPTGMQSRQGIGGIPGYGGRVQTGY